MITVMALPKLTMWMGELGKLEVLRWRKKLKRLKPPSKTALRELLLYSITCNATDIARLTNTESEKGIFHDSRIYNFNQGISKHRIVLAVTHQSIWQHISIARW
jgi:hypothetical protein